MLPDKINCVVVNTGNLINSKELKKKAMQTPTEEVFDSISTTFLSWLENLKENENDVEDLTTIFCVSPNAIKVNGSDRADLKISVKIFLEDYNCENLKASIQEVMNALDISVIDSLILALPPPSNEEKFNLEKMKPLWTELENFLIQGKCVTLGMSDLDAPELAELYEWTEIKPSVNQVNIESCCVMPPELIAFAKEHDIQLLTHNDSRGKQTYPCMSVYMNIAQFSLEPQDAKTCRRSPDLNPIGHLWDVLEQGVKGCYTTPTTLTELWTALASIWQVMPMEHFMKLVESMLRHVAAVIMARGGPTHY
ncbi:glutamate--cysteine ligase regulatory subunit [Trichonephila clavipes]|nr:glutamate--cysteine ligase regulatory subunit [Trichonephila clavipes]